MMKKNRTTIYSNPTNELIIFISGVPGVGKTTVSYQLLTRIEQFRIIEETDLIREILRGYNEHLRHTFGNQVEFVFNQINITDHTKLLSFEEAKIQCQTMLSSFEKIIARQRRKGISTIINGVHVIPEVLKDITENVNVLFFNLYVTDENELYKRIYSRDSSSYMLDCIPFIFQTNNDLYISTEQLTSNHSNIFNINVTGLSIDETINRITSCIKSIMVHGLK